MEIVSIIGVCTPCRIDKGIYQIMQEHHANASYPGISLPFISIRSCFYLLTPQETYFKTMKDVPPLIARIIPPATVMMILEAIFLLISGKKKEIRLHSAVNSWASAAMFDAFSIFILRGIEFSAYQWTFDNFRLFTLPWNTFSTYLFALMTVEFCSYWWHRMGHEMAIVWAAHELHHSSDDYNLSVAFRNSAPMRLFRWVFYLPLALLGLPTSIMATHLALGAIFNIASHHHAIPKLGKVLPGIGHVIEFIFVTPSHHRVHHGINKYCIDKNYGQYMIIWDRLFGTFVEEKEDEPLTYGSLTQPQTYDMAKLQVSSFVKLWQKFQSMETFGDKMRALFYGPGWFPGTPRLGNPDDIPDLRGRAKYDPQYPKLVSVYLVLNAFTVFYSYLNMASRLKDVSEFVQFINLVYLFFGFSAIGGIYDKQTYAPWLEIIRIVMIMLLNQIFPMFSPGKVSTFAAYVHVADILMWPFIFRYIQSHHLEPKTMKEKKGSEKQTGGKNGVNRKLTNGSISNSKIHQDKISNGKIHTRKTANGKLHTRKTANGKL